MMLPDSSVTHLCTPYGVLLRRTALAHGVSDRTLARLVDSGVLVKLRHGAYCLRGVYLSADRAERHRLLCRAVLDQYDDSVAASHASSCLMQGGPDFGLDLGRAHVTHFGGGGRRTARLRHHLGECRVGDVRRVEGRWVTMPARAVLETTTVDGVEAGLVQANHFLRAQHFTLDDLRAAVELQTFWPGSLRQHPVLHLAEPRVESVGESRCVYTFFTQGLPAPVPQFEVRHPSGAVAARVDFAWPRQRVLLEFDGREKYHRYRKPGETIEAMVMREKAREDLIRRLTGWTVIRVSWADLEHPARLARRIRAAFAGAR